MLRNLLKETEESLEEVKEEMEISLLNIEESAGIPDKKERQSWIEFFVDKLNFNILEYRAIKNMRDEERSKIN